MISLLDLRKHCSISPFTIDPTIAHPKTGLHTTWTKPNLCFQTTVTRVPCYTVQGTRLCRPCLSSLPLLFYPQPTNSFGCPSCPRPLNVPPCLQRVPPSTQSVARLSYQGQSASVYEQVATNPEENAPNISSPSRKYAPGIDLIPGACRLHGGTSDYGNERQRGTTTESFGRQSQRGSPR